MNSGSTTVGRESEASSVRATPGGGLVQACVPLSFADPWAYADLGEALGEPSFLWHEPGERTLAAYGVAAAAADLSPAGLEAWCSEISKQVERPADTQERELLFLGGRAFEDRSASRAEGDLWAGWGAGGFWLPTLLIESHAEGCLATITAPRDALDAWRETLADFDAERRPVDPPAPRLGYHTLDTCGEREAWTGRVSALVDTMSAQTPPFRKVVLARAQQLEAAPGRRFDPTKTAWHLRRQQPGCVTFAWRNADGSAFVGATPELLCRVRGGEVETSALAGTAPRGRTPGEDQALATTLRATSKERQEHRLVVEGILESLQRLGVSASSGKVPRIRQLKDVQHLETPISGKLPANRGVMEVVETLHPTPAVGGTPRVEALSWLTQHEGLDRGHYAAPIGWLDSEGQGALYVALRSVLISGDSAWAFAGAGIVADSNPDAEWREVNHKLRAIRGALTTVEVDGS